MATKNDTQAEIRSNTEGKEGGEATAAKKGWLSRKLIIMAAGGVVGLAALGGGGYFFFGHHGGSRNRGSRAGQSSRRFSSTCRTCW